MNKWLIIAIFSAVVAIIVLYATGQENQENQKNQEEGFATIDLNTAKAQRQQMQWEGERRYNNFARVQSPYAGLSADAVDDALRQEFPVASKRDSSLLSLLPTSLMGAADDGTNKQGDRLEQTGVLTEKIAFCESLVTTNCDALSDPRYAECGICHKEGISSTGKNHKGGMFISSDDQIRANQLAKANGDAAKYKPTIGTCNPANFTVMKENCVAKGNSLMCETTSAPSSNNQCGQCFSGSESLIYVGPKPVTFPVVLNVSHPGIHNANGVGLRIVYPDGSSDTLQSSPKKLLDHKQITLEATEGDRFQIVIYGAPAVWCAWFSSVDGTRTVSLDIGLKSVSPTNGFMIGGDKRSKTINKALEKETAWPEFKKIVPDTVLWFMRRNEVVPPAIIKATYGTADAPTTVTASVQTAAGFNQELVVRNLTGGDPAANRSNFSLILSQDTGGIIKANEGSTIRGSRIYNMVTIDCILPATLSGPYYEPEQDLCSTGPMVFTETGAGIMGSHSCYNSKGGFNPTIYCITQLFTSAGGTSNGTFYPSTAEAAAKLVVKGDDGKPSLDATVDNLNNMANIAIYGMDNQGAPASFATRKAAALGFLGISMVNPCDGPTAAAGPHTPECLDYLWRTSGNPSQDASSVDPATLPYAYCNSSGLSAPVINGSINLENVQSANEQGGVTGVRAFFNGLFARSQDSSDFDAQAVAMKACYGPNIDTSLKSPPVCKVIEFKPPAPSALAVWYDGADPFGNGSVPGDGARISRWINKAGNSAYDAVASSPAVYSAANKALYFNNNLYATNYPADPITETIFMVFNTVPPSSTSYNAALLSGYTGARGVWVGYTDFPGGNRGAVGVLSSDIHWNIATPTGSYNYGTTALVRSQISGNRSSVSLNGSAARVSAINNDFTGGTKTFIGEQHGAGRVYNFNGYAMEIMIYTTVLNAATIAEVEAGLIKKWGIVKSTPAPAPAPAAPPSLTVTGTYTTNAANGRIYYTITGPATFVSSVPVQFFAIGGGGGSGSRNGGGGGGVQTNAGVHKYPSQQATMNISPGSTYTVKIGAGGTSGMGGNTTITGAGVSITALGGANGGASGQYCSAPSGGSGGGAGGCASIGKQGGSTNMPPESPITNAGAGAGGPPTTYTAGGPGLTYNGRVSGTSAQNAHGVAVGAANTGNGGSNGGAGGSGVVILSVPA